MFKLTTWPQRLLRFAVALTLLAADASAAPTPNGTVQAGLATFAGTTTRIITFRVQGGIPESPIDLGKGEQAQLTLQFVEDGNNVLPPPEPFPAPSSVQFEFKRNNGSIPAKLAGTTTATTFKFSAQDAAVSPFVPRTADQMAIRLDVKKAGKQPDASFWPGEYRFTFTFTGETGSQNLSDGWTLEITGLPASVRALIFMSETQGRFVKLDQAGPSAAGCPSGQSCQAPCGETCAPGETCHPCPFPPPPWRHWVFERELPKYFPRPPWPCLQCPEPWKLPIRDGFDQVLVAFTPLDKAGKPIGPEKANQIQLAIKGGEPIGELVDEGDGQYLQLIEHRLGEPPRVSATALGVTSAELFAGPQPSPSARLYKTLTYLLGALLLAAVARVVILTRQGAIRG